MMRSTLFIIGVLLFAQACNMADSKTQSANPANAKTEGQKPTVNKADEEKNLRETDTAWSASAAKKDADAVAGFMTDDGSTLAPNEPAAKGREAVKKGWTGILSLKDLNIKWEPATVEVADSGEIGYTSGTWTMDWTGDKGEKMKDNGKYLEVWKKVDGKWKCYLDMYSSDNPPPKQ
jgi:uncharacterized protein (TIGR02246 family)